MKYKVITVTNNLENYPKYAENNKNYPQLIKYIKDECTTFIVSTTDPDDFYPANEFFMMKKILEIETVEK